MRFRKSIIDLAFIFDNIIIHGLHPKQCYYSSIRDEITTKSKSNKCQFQPVCNTKRWVITKKQLIFQIIKYGNIITYLDFDCNTKKLKGFPPLAHNEGRVGETSGIMEKYAEIIEETGIPSGIFFKQVSGLH